MISDADAEAIFASPQAPETERGMMRVPSPDAIILDGQFLYLGWQRPKEFPEPPGGNGSHSSEGHSRSRPFADSVSASPKRKSSLPAAESASICSSHRLCSRARNHWTMCRYSSGGRPSIAASISSTRLMLGVYHRPGLGFIRHRDTAIGPRKTLPASPWPHAVSLVARTGSQSQTASEQRGLADPPSTGA